MKYQLIEEYFETSLFQRTVQEYFDSVLGRMIEENTILSAKGLFMIDGEVKRDFYDMPYHIHILNGLIPVLFVYEKFLQKEGWFDTEEAELYLKIFILGFTFHDANKLLGTKDDRKKGLGGLEIAVAELDKHVDKWAVSDFFTDFEEHKSTVYYLALSTEDRTFVQAEDYAITVNNRRHIKNVQRELCHLADGLASIQNEELESIESLYKAVNRSLKKISNIIDLPISYLKVRPNPYTLLSQSLLQIARRQLHQIGKKMFYATHEGFIFWGEDITNEEFGEIEKAYLKGGSDDIKTLELTKIDAQKCKFGFIGSTEFTGSIIEEIITELGDKFLSLSPNGRKTIIGFDGFVEFTKKMIEVYQMPIDYEEKGDKLYLNFYENENLDDNELMFRAVYCLHKIQWLNPKENKEWGADFNNWLSKDGELLESFNFQYSNTTEDKIVKIEIKSAFDIFKFIDERVKSKNALLKTYLNFVKTYEVIEQCDDIEGYIEGLKQNIINTFSSKNSDDNNVKQELFDRYFEYKGNSNLGFLETYNPNIPIKKEMCAFTGGKGAVGYEQAIAFSLKANGFNNRTVTALGNQGGGTSRVSNLFNAENLLRASLFKISDANLVIYNDFFEAKLDVDRDIINATIHAKNEINILKDGAIQIDKNSKFQYNLYNLDFIKLTPKVEPTFFLVRKCLLMVKLLGIRSYIAGIMTPYQPHKAVFYFENAPRFLKLLGWDNVRLIHLDGVLDEIRLVLTFGKERIESNLLKIANNRLAYFQLYYLSKQNNIYESLLNFYKTNKNQKFNDMTVIEELADLAVELMAATYGEKPINRNSSGSSQTWLIRTSMDILRRYVKNGSDDELVIQTICGEINRKYSVSNSEVIYNYAKGLYETVYVTHWKKKLPPKNVEKEFIYAFAFVFTNKSEEHFSENYAKKLKLKLEEKEMKLNEDNVKSILSENAKKHANKYFEIIKNL